MVKINFIVILLLIVFCQNTSAQNASSEINLAKINTYLLESLFMKKLNDLRVEQKVSMLTRDAVLVLAAQDQATYMRIQKLVTHNQKTKEKDSPSKRV